MALKLRDALPGGDSSLRNAVWEFMRPMLSPGLAALNHDAFVLDHTYATSVALATHRAASDLDLDLDLGELESPAVSSAHTRSLPPKPPTARAGDRGGVAPARSLLA